jgi:hypothetical protein
MKCQNIRSLIDMSSRREPFAGSVRTHLQSCADCRRYADQTEFLISLLRSQTRVETPADFDFKLRARIARAGVETGRSHSLLEILSWSIWGRKAAAGIALALAVIFSTIHLTRSNENMEKSASNNPITATAIDQSLIINSVPAIAEKVKLSPAAVPGQITRSIKNSRENTIEKIDAIEISTDRLSYETFPVYNRQTGQVIQASTRQTFIGAENSAPGVAKRPVFVPSI